jgi:serine/threonine-protein kinase RsbT
MMTLLSPEEIVRVRQKVRAAAVEVGFGLVDQTKIITAASELARNTVHMVEAEICVCRC